MIRLILFLIRLRLGVRKYEPFRFSNQKENNEYMFTDYNLLKYNTHFVKKSDVSLNWLISKECKVVKSVT